MTRRNVTLHLEHSLTSFHEQQAEAIKLDATIAANLKELGYGG